MSRERSSHIKIINPYRREYIYVLDQYSPGPDEDPTRRRGHTLHVEADWPLGCTRRLRSLSLLLWSVDCCCSLEGEVLVAVFDPGNTSWEVGGRR